jgi:nitrile hydratase
MPPEAYLSSSYYEKWFTAITTLLVEKGVATAEEIATPAEIATPEELRASEDARGA